MKCINIAGAGISGMTAGINLAKKGYKVTIYEQGNHAGGRFEADWQFLENWSTRQDALEFYKSINLSTDFFHKPIKEMELLLNGKKHHVKTKSILMYAVNRGRRSDSIDSALYQQARTLGVKFIFNSPKRFDEVDIYAAGPRRPDANILGYYYNADKTDKIIAVYDTKLSRRGYTYLTQFNGVGNLVITDARKACTKETLQVFEKSIYEKYGIKLKQKELFGSIANLFNAAHYYLNGRYYTGESAGLQDPIAGFGMRIAANSGYLCAKAIDENLDYDSLIKKQILKKIKGSVIYRRILFDLKLAKPLLAVFSLFGAGKLLENTDLLKYCMRIMYASKINNVLYPPFIIYSRIFKRDSYKRNVNINPERPMDYLKKN